MAYQSVLITLAAVAIGATSALASHIARRWLARRLRITRETTGMVVGSTASFVMLLLGLPPLKYLATLDRPLLPFIVIAWMVGIGLMRWQLDEL